MDPTSSVTFASYFADVGLILFALFLVLLNGFFVAAEFAMVKLRGTRVETIAGQHGWRGHILRTVHNQLDAYLSACQLGITLARAYQGQGYAAEGLTCLITHLFAVFDLHRLSANIDPNNTASANLLARLGFRHEATHRESLWLNGAYVDEALYAILHREWRQT